MKNSKRLNNGLKKRYKSGALLFDSKNLLLNLSLNDLASNQKKFLPYTNIFASFNYLDNYKFQDNDHYHTGLLNGKRLRQGAWVNIQRNINRRRKLVSFRPSYKLPLTILSNFKTTIRFPHGFKKYEQVCLRKVRTISSRISRNK